MREGLIVTRVAVILHERRGNWARQLRPRLHNQPVRWFETRSRADLTGVLTGLACPVILIDLGRHPAAGLMDLDLVLRLVSDARVLVLDPGSHDEAAGLARAGRHARGIGFRGAAGRGRSAGSLDCSGPATHRARWMVPNFAPGVRKQPMELAV